MLPREATVVAGATPTAGGRVLLVRHGQSAWNGVRYIGWSDVPLDEIGHAQARSLASLLSAEPIDTLYSSPLLRALQTARPLADALGLVPVELPGLREIGLGDLEGRPREAGVRLLRRDPHEAFPGGESIGQAFARALGVRDRLAGDLARGRRVVVVGHRHVNRLLFAAIAGAPSVEDALAMKGYLPKNGSVLDIMFEAEPHGKARICARPLLPAEA